jgi:hypothetical protein
MCLSVTRCLLFLEKNILKSQVAVLSYKITKYQAASSHQAPSTKHRHVYRAKKISYAASPWQCGNERRVYSFWGL